MHVEWQGDHRLLGDDAKQDFEAELVKLGLAPRDFIVEVRQEPRGGGANGLHATRYKLFISDSVHPDRDTVVLDGGEGTNWIAEFVKIVRRHR